MKKLLLSLLFIAFSFTLQAQNKKPTKLETINYLKNALVSGSYVTWDAGQGHKGLSRVSEIEFSDCQIIITTNTYYIMSTNEKTETFYTKYSFNLSIIESVEVIKTNTIVLTAKNNEKLIKRKIQEFNGEIKDLIVENCVITYSEDTEKIAKAFNHLRKLCGAPEPLKF